MDAKANNSSNQKPQSGKMALTIVFGTMFVLALSLIGQQAQLIWDGAAICKAMETKQETIVIPIPGRPGDIYFKGTSRYFIAATSKQVPACYADPSMLDNPRLDEACKPLAQALHMKPEDVYNLILSKRDTTYRWLKKNITDDELEQIGRLNLTREIPPDQMEQASGQVAAILKMDVLKVRDALQQRRGSKFIWLKKELGEDEVEAIKDLKTKKGFRGVGLEYLPVRDYPNHTLASTTLGFVLKSGEPGEGLEAVLHNWLAPKAGVKENLGDSGRRAMIALSETPPKDGNNVFLTIDPVIQDKLEKTLDQAKDKFGAEWVLGVMMDPHTGEILAMYSTPGFDPSRFNEVPNPIMRQNRCLCAPYEPGSAFKPIIAAWAVDSGLVTWETKIDCGSGRFSPPNGGVISDHGSAYGVLTMADVIVHSSNVGMGKLGLMMGKLAVYKGARMFGVGDRVNIQLPDGKHWPGESGGIIRRLRDWDGFSLPRVPFGQEVAVTGLQLTNAYCALANGGELLQPRLVDCITDADGNEIWKSERKVTRRVIKESTSRSIMDVMAGVVEKEYGTGHATTQMEKWTSFGKTGTAQVFKNGQLAGYYTGSFVGGAPVNDPRVVLLVSVHHPTKGGYYGGTVAGPAWKEVMEATLSYLKVAPDRTEPIRVHGTGHSSGF